MKKNLLKLSLFALLAIPSLTGCKKDKDDVPVTVENLVGTYTITTITTNGQKFAPADFPGFADCETDDEYKLNADMTADYIDAGLQCTPPDNHKSTWALQSDNKIEIVDMSGTIAGFDGRNLVVNSTYKDELTGTTINLSITFTKK